MFTLRSIPAADAVMIENCPWPVVFGEVVTVKVALDWPAGTVTLAGTCAQAVTVTVAIVERRLRAALKRRA
jgi:hypothetical protein